MKKFILSITVLLACSAGSVWAQSVTNDRLQDVQSVEATKSAKINAKPSTSTDAAEVNDSRASKSAAKSCCANKTSSSASCSKDKKEASEMSCDKTKKAAGKSSCCQKGGHTDAKADAPHDHSKN